ncbi:high-affinity glucose transporter [Aspergillus homomorphus CBS 101889]|uniref:High-affinity glucose transporter n=1 Tax=Aspergillus homomorphus (strain CBS 101889) TaxID=1450537 RepID=A0A395HZT9_ASPHC|nr:high-affinity glucose transporter [Aspergillus homomorphus CBS 101889]RAL13451.1 high-affinity glucose transporter [Aspergillus homomorphus CBS 101889]
MVAPDSVRDLPWLIWAVAIFGSLSSAGFGFDQAWWASIMSTRQFASRFGSYNHAQESWALSERQQSLGTGLGYAGVILGLLCATPLNERFGRKRSLWIQSAVVCVGVIIESTCQTSYAQFLVGKAIVYFGGGIASNVIPVYQGECAPQNLRGVMAGTYNVFLMVGGLVAALIVYLCRHITTDWAWRGVVVAQIAIPVLNWLSLPILPESPYWLMQRGRLEEAAASLARLRAISLADAQAEIAQLEQQHQVQNQLRQQEQDQSASWSSCFTDPINRRRTIICVGAQVFQQAQGISFVANYQAIFLQQIGFRQVLLMSVIVYVIGIAGNLTGVAITDRLGRRLVLLVSAALLSACMLTIGGLTATPTNNYAVQVAAVVMLMLWFFTFQSTWGPLAWVLTAEVPPAAAVREKMVTLAGFSAYGTGLVIVFVNPYTQAAIGGSVAFIYGGFSVVATVFVWFIVPELKQRSLEEIDEMFVERVSARGFATYRCQREILAEGLEGKVGMVEEQEECVEKV